MNISDFERLLREGNLPQDFPPEEDKWLKLEQDLEKRRRRGGVIAFPKRLSWALAASVLLLISFGLYHHYTMSNGNVELAGKRVTQPVTPSALQPDSILTQIHQANITPTGLAGSTPKRHIQSTNSAHRQNVIPPRVETVLPPDTAAVVKNKDEARIYELPVRDPQRKPARGQGTLHEPDNTAYDVATSRKFNFGVSALYGLSDISKGQYRVSVDARRNLSKRVFANMQLIASAAKITANTSYEYQVINIGPPGAVPSGGTQQAEANYSGNIYTLGLSPSIGFRVTKNVALSAGPDLQKALGGTVSLRNKEVFRNQINNQSLIDEQQPVAGLDLGLQSAAQVAVNRRLALTLLYRYGLTDYLKKADGAIRNSFLSIGLSYQFTH